MRPTSPWMRSSTAANTDGPGSSSSTSVDWAFFGVCHEKVGGTKSDCEFTGLLRGVFSGLERRTPDYMRRAFRALSDEEFREQASATNLIKSMPWRIAPAAIHEG